MWMDHDPGIGPYRSQMTETLCTIPGQKRSDINSISGICYIYFRLKLEPEILNCQVLISVCYRVLLILYLPDKSDLEQQVAAL